MTNIKNFDPNLLGIDQISFKISDSVIYDIEYFKNINSENSLYLVFNNIVGYIIEENNENKYLIFVSTDKNKEVLEKYTELWYEIKNEIETISGNKPIKCGRDFMKIRFQSNDDLPLGMPIYQRQVFLCV